jgi:hypothetical protein
MDERKKIVIRPQTPPPPSSSRQPGANPTVTLPKRLFIALCVSTLLIFVSLGALLLHQSKQAATTTSLGNPGEATSTPAQTTDILNIDLSTFIPEKDVLGTDLPLVAFLSTQNLAEPVVRELVRQAGEKVLNSWKKGMR